MLVKMMCKILILYAVLFQVKSQNTGYGFDYQQPIPLGHYGNPSFSPHGQSYWNGYSYQPVQNQLDIQPPHSLGYQSFFPTYPPYQSQPLQNQHFQQPTGNTQISPSPSIGYLPMPQFNPQAMQNRRNIQDNLINYPSSYGGLSPPRPTGYYHPSSSGGLSPSQPTGNYHPSSSGALSPPRPKSPNPFPFPNFEIEPETNKIEQPKDRPSKPSHFQNKNIQTEERRGKAAIPFPFPNFEIEDEKKAKDEKPLPPPPPKRAQPASGGFYGPYVLAPEIIPSIMPYRDIPYRG